MRKWLLLMLLLLVLVGCSESKNSTLSYEEIQKIMVDTLQTEEGKKAMQQLLADPKFQELLVLDQKTVQTSIETTLLSEDGKAFWKSLFEDPKFQESYAKSLEHQHKKILEGMLTDANTQKELKAFFGQPDMQKQFETILKGEALRKQMEEVVMETIENPLLQTKWQELIKKSGEAASKGKDEEKKSEGGQ
ncbi:MAG: spore germination lipoprotein GerD [Lysinibacillus sp.]